MAGIEPILVDLVVGTGSNLASDGIVLFLQNLFSGEDYLSDNQPASQKDYTPYIQNLYGQDSWSAIWRSADAAQRYGLEQTVAEACAAELGKALYNAGVDEFVRSEILGDAFD